MHMTRRIVLGGAATGLVSLLTGCGFLRPGKEAVVDAIMDAPSVLGAEINFGPGGGLASLITGHIDLDVAGDALRDAFEEAFGRGVEVLHRRFEGDRGVAFGKFVGNGTDGSEFSLRDLVDLGASRSPTLGRFYDHYGIS